MNVERPRVQALLDRIESVEHRLAAHAAASSPAGLTEPEGVTGERWEAGQVWSHVTEFVPHWLDVMRGIVAAQSTEPVPFGRGLNDAGRITGVEQYRHVSPAQLSERVRGHISELRAFIAGLDSEAWLRTGRHPAWGVMTLDRVVETLLVSHLEEHADQLDSLVK